MITNFKIFEELNQTDFFDNPPWEALYNFLKPIFEKDYKEAAGQWMYMSTEIFKECEGGYLHFFKNGITRKYLILDESGQPWNIIDRKWSDRWPEKMGTIIKAVKIGFGEAFKKGYENIQHYSKGCTNVSCSPYLIKYDDEYKNNLFKKLQDAGYQVIGISNTDTQNDIKTKLKKFEK
jgi:hypothetical protein